MRYSYVVFSYTSLLYCHTYVPHHRKKDQVQVQRLFTLQDHMHHRRYKDVRT